MTINVTQIPNFLANSISASNSALANLIHIVRSKWIHDSSRAQLCLLSCMVPAKLTSHLPDRPNGEPPFGRGKIFSQIVFPETVMPGIFLAGPSEPAFVSRSVSRFPG